MQPLPGHPYVLYEAGPDACDQHYIHCHCRGCGQNWQRSCQFPTRTMEWVNRFAALHFHDRVPQQTAGEAVYLYGAS